VYFKTWELVSASVATCVTTPAFPPNLEVGWIGATRD